MINKFICDCLFVDHEYFCKSTQGAKMLKQEVAHRLNEQLNLELFSSNLYLQMSAWCEDKSFSSIAKFLRKHSKEENDHMLKLFDYLVDTGSMPILSSMDAPQKDYKSITELFKKVYEHEQFITQKINDLVDFTLVSKDYSTFEFLQWYVAEQHEEEKLFKTILDKIEMIGDNSGSLFFLDKDFDQVLSQSGLSASIE